ncbi:transferase, transferring glycosyl groups, putative [Ricinus communis]|uniref:Transferase, transferring glycosyl groups, putative n=1 Tax=Ricinus communis TaxID=3988 RepID=B9SCN4_RICCO|nr:transferase, transferring glycosyl groups, putative [Ricinus communis]|eukprot:XP_002523753.1 glycosyltransferase family protein 64 C3 [Ricinus communis]
MMILLKWDRSTFIRTILLYLSLLLVSPLVVLSLRTLPSDPCKPTNGLDPRTLREDQITVLINGYSESRIPLLQTIAATYSASPLVSSVLVLWGNPSTPLKTLVQLAHNLSLSSFGAATISLIRQPSSSLNDRFLPRSSIGTQAVLICDDDVEVDPKSFQFAFRIWRLNPDRLIGFFVRSHDLDLLARKWIYTVHPDKYSIVLTKFMILKSQYLFEYSCKGGPNMGEMRKIVDRMQNCEDILMNFVVADKANIGPILVGAEKVRDWGDARNEDNDVQFGLKDMEASKVRAVGLSSRVGEHRKRRGECIREFHKLLGRMPLRYSYGKVINSVGEQGLCMKGGKLIFCDRHQ